VHVACIRSTRFNRIDQVPGESAIIGDLRENRETIYGDHICMAKKVLNSIETLLEGLGDDSLTPGVLNFVLYLRITQF
jgi:hypothetical protein